MPCPLNNLSDVSHPTPGPRNCGESDPPSRHRRDTRPAAISFRMTPYPRLNDHTIGRVQLDIRIPPVTSSLPPTYYSRRGSITPSCTVPHSWTLKIWRTECPLFLPSPTVVLWHSIAFQLYQNNKPSSNQRSSRPHSLGLQLTSGAHVNNGSRTHPRRN
jgi:hypothetical protein